MELYSPTEYLKGAVLAVQEYTLLAVRSIANLFRQPRYFADTIQQSDIIGVGSLPIVVLTGFFTGAVLALQTSSTLQQFGSLSLIGQLVSFSMVRELGSMQVTEQIDAMRALGTDPTKKLVTPRVVASVVMMFFLTIISDMLGVVGGFVMSFFVLGLDANQYWASSYQKLQYDDIEMGLVKPLLFGFVIATVGCYYGLTAKGGTQGVGRATTQAVVTASVLILLVDLLITRLLMVLT